MLDKIKCFFRFHDFQPVKLDVKSKAEIAVLQKELYRICPEHSRRRARIGKDYCSSLERKASIIFYKYHHLDLSDTTIYDRVCVRKKCNYIIYGYKTTLETLKKDLITFENLFERIEGNLGVYKSFDELSLLEQQKRQLAIAKFESLTSESREGNLSIPELHDGNVSIVDSGSLSITEK